MKNLEKAQEYIIKDIYLDYTLIDSKILKIEYTMSEYEWIKNEAEELISLGSGKGANALKTMISAVDKIIDKLAAKIVNLSKEEVNIELEVIGFGSYVPEIKSEMNKTMSIFASYGYDIDKITDPVVPAFYQINGMQHILLIGPPNDDLYEGEGNKSITELYMILENAWSDLMDDLRKLGA